ncbi:phosphonate ABC transporter ATP-binding protein [Marinimicrococcus flavescens]|uniref:Phosphonate ABC transporter ATP-binding protein n=1 Tax=Marinimicrococcus flavescens TaxID=3031815 RepID=A0AAP3XR78_9PROT|nr:phosphonate ABC transporter ATP-binding protein [Marinimicrococcus flavescens]
MTTAIELLGVCKTYDSGSPVLTDMNFSVGKGEMVALIGASGSGKSTLIRTIAGLLPIDGTKNSTAGQTTPAPQVRIFGTPMQTAGRISSAAGKLRARVGVVFQQFNLVPRLPVLTNVCLGLLGRLPAWRGTLAWFRRSERQQAMAALARVGIAEHALKRGSALSGGQQQRAAIARTLVQGAEILLADEPIASLDPNSARRVMDILAEVNREDGITVVVSLHQIEYALSYCPRTIALRGGRIVYDGPSDALTPAFLSELYGAESAELVPPRLSMNPSCVQRSTVPSRPVAAEPSVWVADTAVAAAAR